MDPCVLLVEFRLRFVRGFGHVLFRWESWLNTPLFAAFPGFVSKLWLAHESRDVYRGVYEWDGPGDAPSFMRAVCGGSSNLCAYRVRSIIECFPGLRRDEVLDRPHLLGGDEAWWRLTSVG